MKQQSRRERTQQTKSHHSMLARKKPDSRAVEQFRRKPYQAAELIREQGKYVERMTVIEYLEKKGVCGIGQGDIKTIQESEKGTARAPEETG